MSEPMSEERQRSVLSEAMIRAQARSIDRPHPPSYRRRILDELHEAGYVIAAAGVEVPEPQAERPQWIRLTGRAPSVRRDAGKVVKVDSWAAGGRRPGVGDRWLYDDEWEPATAPAAGDHGGNDAETTEAAQWNRNRTARSPLPFVPGSRAPAAGDHEDPVANGEPCTCESSGAVRCIDPDCSWHGAGDHEDPPAAAPECHCIRAAGEIVVRMSGCPAHGIGAAGGATEDEP